MQELANLCPLEGTQPIVAAPRHEPRRPCFFNEHVHSTAVNTLSVRYLFLAFLDQYLLMEVTARLFNKEMKQNRQLEFLLLRNSAWE